VAIPAEVPIPPELAVDDEPFTDEELDTYFAVMDAGPNAELRPDGSADPDMADAVEVGHAVAGWRVEGDDRAEWALRKLAVSREEVSRLEQQAADWRRKIEAWFEQAAAPHRRRALWAIDVLEDYALRLREHGGPATLHLPSGTIKTTESKPAIEVVDDAEVASWLETIDGRLTPEQAALWDEAMEAAGLAIDSDEFVKRTPKVYVGPLRKVARIDERIVQHRARVVFGDCEHVRMVELEAADDPALPVRGEVMACPICPQDSIDGDALRPVAEVELETVVALIVVGPDGLAIPGAQVRPGGVTPKVELR
jgi:hypothetical protein